MGAGHCLWEQTANIRGLLGGPSVPWLMSLYEEERTHVTLEADIGVMQLQAKERQGAGCQEKLEENIHR